MAKKSLSKNAFYNVIYKCLNVVFPLITMAYVSRILLPIGVGKVASAQNIVAYFVLIASLGLPTYGVKVIASYRDDRRKSSKAFSELFTINAISTIICSFVYIMIVMSVDFFQTKIAISMVVGIQLFANVINIDWLYQGYEEYRYITIRSIIVKILSLLAVFIFVKTPDDYIVYAFITALSLIANFVMNILKLNSLVTLDFKNLMFRKHFKSVFALLASTIAIEIYVLGGTTILNVLKGEEDVAFYTYATKAVSVVRTLIVAVCAVFLPRLNYFYSHGQFDAFNDLASKGIRIILNLCIPSAIGLFILSDDCVQLLFGDNYYPVIPSMRMLCISLVTIALSNFTGYQILVTLGKEKVVLYSTIFGAIVNLGINYILVPSFGHYGAAIAAVVTEALIAIYQFYYVLKSIPIKVGLIDIKEIIVPSLLMIVPMLFIKYLECNIIIEILFCFVSGLFVFIFSSFMMKNKIVLMFLEKANIHFNSKYFNNTKL